MTGGWTTKTWRRVRVRARVRITLSCIEKEASVKSDSREYAHSYTLTKTRDYDDTICTLGNLWYSRNNIRNIRNTTFNISFSLLMLPLKGLKSRWNGGWKQFTFPLKRWFQPSTKLLVRGLPSLTRKYTDHNSGG